MKLINKVCKSKLARCRIFLTALIALSLLSVGCSTDAVDEISPGDLVEADDTTGEEWSVMNEGNDDIPITVPAIDQQVPDHLETATLALG